MSSSAKVNPKPKTKTATRKPQWDLRLYIAGETQRSKDALANLRAIVAEHLPGVCRLEIIDLRRNPTLARGDQIVAVPTLVRKIPPPLKRIIGDLSNTERVLVGLDYREAERRR